MTKARLLGLHMSDRPKITDERDKKGGGCVANFVWDASLEPAVFQHNGNKSRLARLFDEGPHLGKSDENDSNEQLDIAFFHAGRKSAVAMISVLGSKPITAFIGVKTQQEAGQHTEWNRDDAELLEVLTPRQHQIMDLVLAGKPSKNIATDLGISRRTVENHRAAIMLKTGSKSIPALARLALMCAMTASITSDTKLKLSLA